jgi:shikimate kinase
VDAHLVLVGLPGAGKTTVGQQVAAMIGCPFMDLDHEIQRRQGRTIAQIFAAQGEPAFRQLETALTRELATHAPMVIAPGGGWAADPHNVALLRPPARLVHLLVSPETALKRMGADTAVRPLLSGADPLDQLRQLARRRLDSYAAADWVVNTEHHDLHGVIAQVAGLASAPLPDELSPPVTNRPPVE